jgi:hypothetical protein
VVDNWRASASKLELMRFNNIIHQQHWSCSKVQQHSHTKGTWLFLGALESSVYADGNYHGSKCCSSSNWAMKPSRETSNEKSQTGKQGLRKPDAAWIVEEEIGNRILCDSRRWWIVEKWEQQWQQSQQFQWWCRSMHKWRTFRISRWWLLLWVKSNQPCLGWCGGCGS